MGSYCEPPRFARGKLRAAIQPLKSTLNKKRLTMASTRKATGIRRKHKAKKLAQNRTKKVQKKMRKLAKSGAITIK